MIEEYLEDYDNYDHFNYELSDSCKIFNDSLKKDLYNIKIMLYNDFINLLNKKEVDNIIKNKIRIYDKINDELLEGFTIAFDNSVDDIYDLIDELNYFGFDDNRSVEDVNEIFKKIKKIINNIDPLDILNSMYNIIENKNYKKCDNLCFFHKCLDCKIKENEFIQTLLKDNIFKLIKK